MRRLEGKTALVTGASRRNRPGNCDRISAKEHGLP